VLMMRLKSDLATALMATRDGLLNAIDLRWNDDAALTVVMAANGYPGEYAKGSEIRGLYEASRLDKVQIFHAGTARKNGKIVASGGRVLSITATGKTIGEAQKRAYTAVDQIDWPAGDATILALLAGYVVLALLGVYIVRERLTHRRLRMAVAGPEN